MITYTSICLKNNIMCYQMTKTLSDNELIEQLSFWNISSSSELIQRWNQQPESRITKLKWIYYLK